MTEIKIKKISKYDSDNNSKHIANIELELEEINNHLNNLNDYTIRYFKSLINKYGDMHQRKTKISTFDAISVRRNIKARPLR